MAQPGVRQLLAADKAIVVGVGDDGWAGLTPTARAALESAEILIGSPRVLDMLPSLAAERRPLNNDLDRLVEWVGADLGRRKLAILAEGDPLLFGVARYLFDRFGKDRFDVLPHVSAMQLAFARVKEDWDEAYLSDAGRHELDHLLDQIRGAERVGLFTGPERTPVVVAQAMVNAGLERFRVYVCENLGTRHEVITQGTPAEIAVLEFGPLNVMVLVRQPGATELPDARARLRRFGNADEMFRQSRPKRGLLTPAEVRTLALAELNLRDESVVWDVGAGSGAVAIEAALLAPRGRVYAIEPDWEDGELIRANATAFGALNVEIVAARAPEAFATLPDPHAVFLGGLGRDTSGVVGPALARLQPGGTLVANVASLEGAHALATTLRQTVGRVRLLMVNLARGVDQLDTIRFEAANPSFLLAAEKPR